MADLSKEQRASIWEALCDADMLTRYWAAMGQRYQQRVKYTNIFLAVVSCSTVASWSLWKQYPGGWQSLSVATAIFATAQPFLNISGTMEQIFNAHSKWVELELSYQQLWDNLGITDGSEAWKAFQVLQRSQVILATECVRLPVDEELKLDCYEDVYEIRSQQNQTLSKGKRNQVNSPKSNGMGGNGNGIYR
jgi:hypothetical protein